MSRSGYSDDCENVQLWRGAVDRAMSSMTAPDPELDRAAKQIAALELGHLQLRQELQRLRAIVAQAETDLDELARQRDEACEKNERLRDSLGGGVGDD